MGAMATSHRRIWVSPWLYVVGPLWLVIAAMMVGLPFSGAWPVTIVLIPMLAMFTALARTMITSLEATEVVVRRMFWKTTRIAYSDIGAVDVAPYPSASGLDTDVPCIKRRNGDKVDLTGQAGYRLRKPNKRVVRFCEAVQARLPRDAQ